VCSPVPGEVETLDGHVVAGCTAPAGRHRGGWQDTTEKGCPLVLIRSLLLELVVLHLRNSPLPRDGRSLPG
jgi:hypothetical protein